MRFLLDGYNLMHALGMAPRPGGVTLARARIRFVEWLATEAGPNAGNLRIVFDSHRTKEQPEQILRDIHIRFSIGQTADDLIETIIQAENRPAELVVVSNDHRLQLSAGHRGCSAWTCEEFIDWLAAEQAKKPSAAAGEAREKPVAPSGDEIQNWLKLFGKN